MARTSNEAFAVDWKKIGEILNDAIPKWCAAFNIPGLAVEVWQDGHPKYSCYTGYADVNDQRLIQPNTIFKIASISKTFTAVGLMHFYEKGLIDFDKDVNRYLPESYAPVTYKNSDLPITLRHLVTHRSGIGELRKLTDIFKKGFNINVYGNKPLPPLSHYFKGGITTSVPPGQKYAYSNNGVGLVGHILELLSQKPFEEFIRDIILNPLELKSTFFHRTEEVREREATGYLDNRNKGKYRQVRYLQCGLTPAGNGYSTARDLSKFAQMLMKKPMDQDTQSQILSPKTISKMFQPWYQAAPDLEAMGCIFMRYPIEDQIFITHDGATSGFTSGMLLHPSQRLSVVVLTNIDEIFASHGTLKIRNRLAHLITGLLPLSLCQLKEEKQREIIKEIILKEQSNDLDQPQQMTIDPAALREKLVGCYGPQKGLLTNTRYYMRGAEFYIRQRKSNLYLYSFYGAYKNGVRLYPTKNPHKYYYLHPSFGGSLKFKEFLVFNEDSENQITYFALGKSKFWRRPFFKRLKTRIFLVLLSVLVLGSILVFFLR